MSIFDSLFGKWGGKAENTAGNIGKQIKPVYDPYMNAGQGSLNQLQPLLQMLTQNPGQFYNQIGQNFQQSPGFQFSVDQATNAAKNAGAASGMAGSPAVQNALAQQITGMASQDYGNYMSGATGMFNQGLSGLTGMSQLGYNAANSYGNNLTDIQKMLSQLQYSRAGNEAQSTGGLFGGLLGMFGGSQKPWIFG
jgi:hypothetical protein